MQQYQQHDMAHILGSFCKWAAIVLVFGFSLVMSLAFFTAIAPPDKPYFPVLALSLTEGGFVLWMATFMLTRHNPASKVIALIMVVASGICCLMIAGYELYQLLAAHYDLVQNSQITQLVSIGLEAIFALHFVAFVIDLFASYFARPGHSFRNPPNGVTFIPTGNVIPARGTSIPAQNGNSIPNGVTIEEVDRIVTGRLAAIQGESSPLALPSRATAVSLAHDQTVGNTAIAERPSVVKAAMRRVGSAVVQKWNGSTKSGSEAGGVLGEANGTISENTSTSITQTADGPEGEPTALDSWAMIYEGLNEQERGGLSFPDWVRRAKFMAGDTQADEEGEEEEEL